MLADIGSWLTFAVIVGVTYLLVRRDRRKQRAISHAGLGSGGFLLGVIVGFILSKRSR